MRSFNKVKDEALRQYRRQAPSTRSENEVLRQCQRRGIQQGQRLGRWDPSTRSKMTSPFDKVKDKEGPLTRSKTMPSDKVKDEALWQGQIGQTGGPFKWPGDCIDALCLNYAELVTGFVIRMRVHIINGALLTVRGITVLFHFHKNDLMLVIICKNDKHLVTLYNVIFSNMTGILSHLSYIFY